MTRMTKHVSLVVVAALALLFTALAAPARAQSAADENSHIGAQASSEPGEVIDEDDDASLVSKGRRQRDVSPGSQIRQTPQDNSAEKTKRANTKRVTDKLGKTQGASQSTAVRQRTSARGQAGKASPVSSQSDAGKSSSISSRSTARDLSKVKSLSIANETKAKPSSLGDRSSQPSGSGGLSVKTAPALGIKTAPAPTGGTAGTPGKVKVGDPRVTTTAGDLGIKTAPGVGIKTAPAPTGGVAGTPGKATPGDPRITTTAGDLGIKTAPGLGIKTAPGLGGKNLADLGIRLPPGLGIKNPPGQGGQAGSQGGSATGGQGTPAPGQGGSSNTQTQGDVTGGGPGSVTTGGVQSGGGPGSQTQGGTVSTGGGNTVGGIQQSGDNNTVNVNQTSTTNTTNVTNISGGGGGFGGGGGVVEVSSAYDAPVEYEPEPVIVTRAVSAPADSCPTVVELNQLGFGYYQNEAYSSAEEAFRRALELLDNQACKNIPLKATTLENLAFTLDKLGRPDDGVKYQEKAQLLRRMQ